VYFVVHINRYEINFKVSFKYKMYLKKQSGLKHHDASFTQCKPLSDLQNRHGPLLRLRLSFLSLLKGDLLPNFNKIVESELQIVVVLSRYLAARFI
jgi:hypothetical protein